MPLQSLSLPTQTVRRSESLPVEVMMTTTFERSLKDHFENVNYNEETETYSLIGVFFHDQSELLVLEVESLDFFPEEETNLLIPIENKRSCWRQSQP